MTQPRALPETPYETLIRKPMKPEDHVVHKIYANISMADVLRNAHLWKKVQLIRKIFCSWKLNGKIADFSLVGKSVMELYVYEMHKDDVVAALNSRHIPIDPDFNVCENSYRKRAYPNLLDYIVNRLSFVLIRNEKRPAIAEKALEGHNHQVKERATQKAKDNLSKKSETRSVCSRQLG